MDLTGKRIEIVYGDEDTTIRDTLNILMDADLFLFGFTREGRPVKVYKVHIDKVEVL